MFKTRMRKALSLVLAASMVFSMAACGKKDDSNVEQNQTQNSQNNESTGDNSSNESSNQGSTATEETTYTYNTYTTALATNWNPHTWELNIDDIVLGYVSSPFCTMQILDSENGVYQWVYEMATSITDVTKDNQADLTKYNVTLQEGKTVDTTEAGYVFEIKLNPNAKWEDGTPINADSYVYSMQQLLDSKMKNYRANLYYSGESAVAGGNAYYNSESPIYSNAVEYTGDVADYSYDLEAGIAAGQAYVSNSTTPTLGYSIGTLLNSYGYGTKECYDAVAAENTTEASGALALAPKQTSFPQFQS